MVAPDYYESFKCIASDCKNSCCVGWEIDIDDFTLEYYNSLDTTFGKRIRDNISFEGDAAHFCLDKNERCPFLNKNNLCDIITALSENALCDICADHPRFRNYLSERTEIGVGLCCEAAATIVVRQKEKTKLVTLETDFADDILTQEEEKLLSLREKLFEIIQTREESLEKRIEKVRNFAGIKKKERTPQKTVEFYLSLERLNEDWGKLLENAVCNMADKGALKWQSDEEIAFENLLHYFIFRHLTGAAEDGRVSERLSFALESVEFIMLLCALKKSEKGILLVEDIENFARMYSSEVEYSEENLEKCFDFC